MRTLSVLTGMGLTFLIAVASLIFGQPGVASADPIYYVSNHYYHFVKTAPDVSFPTAAYTWSGSIVGLDKPISQPRKLIWQLQLSPQLASSMVGPATCVTDGQGTGADGQQINYHDRHDNISGDYVLHSTVPNLRDYYTQYTFQTNCYFKQQVENVVEDAYIKLTVTIKVGKNN